MSTPAGQQLPHQPSVLLDAVLNVHLLLLQGNTALSLPVAPAPIWPLGFLPGAAHKSSKKYSPFGEWGAPGAWQSSWTNSCTGKGNPTPTPLQSGRSVGGGCRSFSGESPPEQPPDSLAAPRLLPAPENSQGCRAVSQGTPRGLPPLPARAEEAPRPLVPGLLLGRDPFSYRWLLVPALSPAEGLRQNKRAGSQEGWHRSHSLPLRCA